MGVGDNYQNIADDGGSNYSRMIRTGLAYA
jgi:hypothetical protein